jgi:putative acetyltransferase
MTPDKRSSGGPDAISMRPARPEDVAALSALYARAVRVLGPGHYSPAQVAIWAAFAADGAFADFILDVDTVIAELAGTPAGFCGMAADGHVASVYVAPELAGRGLGSALLSHALASHPAPTSGRWYAEASVFSLPLFLKHGFVESGRESTSRHGVRFERHLVERAAPAPSGNTRSP